MLTAPKFKKKNHISENFKHYNKHNIHNLKTKFLGKSILVLNFIFVYTSLRIG